MRSQETLAWYIIPKDSILANTQQILIETLTLSQMFITPLVLVYTEVRDLFITPQLVIDSIWCVGIVMSFVAADKANTTFKQISTKYLKSGRFFIDVLSTLPAMISGETVPVW